MGAPGASRLIPLQVCRASPDQRHPGVFIRCADAPLVSCTGGRGTPSFMWIVSTCFCSVTGPRDSIRSPCPSLPSSLVVNFCKATAGILVQPGSSSCIFQTARAHHRDKGPGGLNDGDKWHVLKKTSGEPLRIQRRLWGSLGDQLSSVFLYDGETLSTDGPRGPAWSWLLPAVTSFSRAPKIRYPETTAPGVMGAPKEDTSELQSASQESGPFPAGLLLALSHCVSRSITVVRHCRQFANVQAEHFQPFTAAGAVRFPSLTRPHPVLMWEPR
ncbi:hypothetical protein CB1_000182005 [Camelus ferus]|nr:hypothetical protein CB1_000182005 [Camelus ferus]